MPPPYRVTVGFTGLAMQIRRGMSHMVEFCYADTQKPLCLQPPRPKRYDELSILPEEFQLCSYCSPLLPILTSTSHSRFQCHRASRQRKTALGLETRTCQEAHILFSWEVSNSSRRTLLKGLSVHSSSAAHSAPWCPCAHVFQ